MVKAKHAPAKVTKAAATGTRSSSRTKSQPVKFRPGGSSDVPSSIDDMIESVATDAIARSSIPFSTDAEEALKDALGPALDLFFEAAFARAASKKRDDPNDEDLQATLAAYKKQLSKN
jgi:hypothetical protein